LKPGSKNSIFPSHKVENLKDKTANELSKTEACRGISASLNDQNEAIKNIHFV